MMWKIGDDYQLDPVLEKAMDVLFILHADHEQNGGTTAMRLSVLQMLTRTPLLRAAASALYGLLRWSERSCRAHAE